MCYPVIAISCIDRGESCWSSELPGHVIEQYLRQDPIICILWRSLKISSGISLYCRAVSSIRCPNIILFAALKSASMSKMAHSLDISLTPGTFSSITHKPVFHLVRATPWWSAKDVLSTWRSDKMSELAPGM